jgi:hypothetical protein
MSKNRKSKVTSEAPHTDPFQSLKSWQLHALCLLLLFLAPVLLHSPSIVGGQVLTTSDIVQWRAGAESLMEYREQTGEQAQWSTNMFGGMPAYVISNLERFPSFDTVILPLFKFVFPLMEYWILLGGAYFFLLTMGYRPLVSVIGALIIGLTTYIPIIVGAGHNTKFFAYTYIPWIFAGYKLMSDRFLNPKNPGFPWYGTALFLIAFMLHVRAGHPQVTYYFLFLLAIWWISDGIQAYKANSAKPWLTFTAVLSGIGLLAVLSVVDQYYALLQYSGASIRGGSDIAGQSSGLAQDYAFVWSQGWGELLTLIIPGLFGGSETYWGPKPFTGGPHYFGAIAFLLLIIGVVFRPGIRHKAFWITGILAMLFSLGYHFSLLNDFMFNYFPMFNKFRTPEMWLLLSVFCFTIPALDGLDSIVERTRNRDLDTKKWIIMSVLVLAPGVLFFTVPESILSLERDNERIEISRQLASANQISVDDPRVRQTVDRIMSTEILPSRVDMAKSDSLRYLILTSIAIGLILVLASGKLASSFVLLGLIIVVMIDMVGVGRSYVNEYSYQQAGFDAERVIESRKRPIDAWLQNAVKTYEPWEYRVLPLDTNPFNNAIPSYFYQSLGGYSGAKLGIYQDMIDEALFGGPIGINTGVLAMLNTKFVTYNGQVPGFAVAHQAGESVALELPSVLPKAYFVENVSATTDPRVAMDFIKNPDFDPSSQVIVLGSSAPTAGVDSAATVRVTHYDAHRISLESSRSSTGFLVLGEIFYEDGWKASIDGEMVEIYRTNYLLRGIEVPSGDRTIEFVYEPDWVKPVQFISTVANISILIFVIGFTFIGYQRRSSNSN